MIDPGPYKPDLRRAQAFATGRHGRAFMQACNAPHQRACCTVSSNDISPVIAAFHGPNMGCERKPALFPGQAMAFEASVLEDWLNVPGKVHRHCCGLGQMWINPGGREMDPDPLLRQHAAINGQFIHLAFEKASTWLPFFPSDLDWPCVANLFSAIA